MELETLLRLLRRFTPEDFTYQDKHEDGLKKVMIETLEKEGDFPLYRDRESAHFTASSMIFNPSMDRVLMVFHNIYQLSLIHISLISLENLCFITESLTQ